MIMKGKTTENSHTLLKNFLTLAQFSGAFPLYNIRNPSPNELKFKWASWRVAYAILMFVTSSFCGILALRRALVDDSVISRSSWITRCDRFRNNRVPSALQSLIGISVSALFFLCVTSSVVIFTQIARGWPSFIKSLCKVEEDFDRKYPCPISLKWRINIAGLLIFAAALCEHILSTINYVNSFKCRTNIYGWERYFKNEFHYIFAVFPYRFTYGVIILIFTWMSLTIWNLGDTFIILLSLIISSRFRQISNTLRVYLREIGARKISFKNVSVTKFQGSQIPSLENNFFSQIREDYNKIASICNSWNDLFANLVLMSYTYNLTFILIQLFNSLRHMDTSTERIYFFYSFGFVIMRTVAVSVCAASVNQESKNFLPILNSVPSALYCIEVHRLIVQINVDSSALTGRDFFRITRGLVLNVAAAIITYELVLIQFNQATLEKYMTPNINICE